MQLYRRPGRKTRRCRYWWFDGWDWLVNHAVPLAGTSSANATVGQVTLDPHTHSLFSHCSISQPEAIIRRAVRLGLGAIAVTDHDDIAGALDAMRCAEDLKRRGEIPETFLVIPGAEINSAAGHIVALFVQENLPCGLSPADTVYRIHEAGGLAVAPHPYHSTGIGDAIYDAPFDAVEMECGSVFEAGLVRRNRGLAQDPRLAGVAKIAGSDAHYVSAVGTCYTVLSGITEPALDAVREAISAGRTGVEVPRSLVRLRKFLGSLPTLR